MTDWEWLAGADPDAMLDALIARGDASDRKLRLFAVAACRRIDSLLHDGRSRRAVEVAEALADGLAVDCVTALEDAENAMAALETPSNGRVFGAVYDPGPYAIECAANAARHTLLPASGRDELCWWGLSAAVMASAGRRISELYRNTEGGDQLAALRLSATFKDQERAAQAQLIRDIFGNPFRPVALINSRWLTVDVVDVAKAIYEVRAFDRLPILADALMDAGCDNADVIAHCRGSGPHVRGCWVVDLILGKS